MKTLVTISAVTIAAALSGCQMGQQSSQQSSQGVVNEAPMPVQTVSTGTCIFGSKSGQRSVVTTHTDCALRGGNFMSSAPTYGAPSYSAPSYSAPTYSVPASPVLQNGSGVRVETL